MDEAIAFLRAAADAEWRANRANYSEPDDAKLQAHIDAWNALFGAGLSSGLSRPSRDSPGIFMTPSYIEATERQQRRTLFAIARFHTADGREVFRGWLGDTELGPRGEGMRQSLCAVRESGAWMIVARYRVCSQCVGARSIAGDACDACDATGLYFRGGIDFGALGRPLELRKLEAPSDPRYLPAYQALES